jgi:hypothetical protein
MELNDALATLKSSQHFGEHQMMEKSTIYSWFSTRTMEHSLLVGFHGNRLVLWSPWQPFASSLATAFHGPSIYCSLSDSGPGDAADEPDDIREADDAGGRTADERRTNGCIKPCCEAFKRCPRAVVNSAEHWTHWRASDDGEI